MADIIDQAQDRIDIETERILKKATVYKGESSLYCHECGEPILEARRQAVQGVVYVFIVNKSKKQREDIDSEIRVTIAPPSAWLELPELKDFFKDRQPGLSTEFLINRNELSKKEQKMFNQFENLSTKVIAVDKHTYELIANHDLRAIHLNKSTATALSKLSSFLIFCDDAAIEVSFITMYESQASGPLSSLSVVEFEIADGTESD